jgi:hypothetical protein
MRLPRNDNFAAQRALCNQRLQKVQDESLAAFLFNRNRTVPPGPGLKLRGDVADRQERDVRQRRMQLKDLEGRESVSDLRAQYFSPLGICCIDHPISCRFFTVIDAMVDNLRYEYRLDQLALLAISLMILTR